MAMALDERNEQSDSFDDPEATTNLQNSFDRSTRIVNSVPGCGHRSQRNSVTRRDSVGSDSMSSVPLRRNSGIVTDSANSSEGFSLADDTGDSLPGSEVFSEGTQSQSLSTPSSQSAAAGPSKVLAAQEILLPLSYRVVQGARRCFWLIWIVGTVSVTTSLWAMARNEWDDRMMEIEIIIEQSQDVSKMIFEQMIFESQVTLLEQLWKARLESKLQAMETLTTTMTSTAAIEEMNWPYVTLPDFSRRVANMQGFTFWMPLIQRGSDDMDATTWGNYSQEHLDDWLYRNDSLARRERQQIRHLQDAGDNLTDIVSDEIFQTRPDGSIHASDTSSSHFFPIWHHAHPIVPSLINYDLLSHAQLGPSLQAVLQTKQPVLTKTFLKSNVPEGDFFLLSTLRDNLPTMFLFYPIFEKLKSEGVQLKVAGVLASSISWEDILKAKNILISPLQVNIPAASCSNQTDDNGQDIFVQLAGQNSISLLGSNLTSAGSGYQRFQNWVDLTADIDYYGEPLLLDASSGGCAYDLQLIQEGATDIGGIKVDEENRVPTNIVIGTLAFALAVALAFVYFERTVQDRDRALTQEATRTRNIVASLFPSQFHDRLFQSNADGLNNAIPKNEDFQRVFHGVEAAMSSHFELPLEDEDVSNFEVPLKAEDNFEAKGINNFESQQNTGAPPPRARSLSNDRMNHKQSNRGDSLSQSTHSKSRSSPLKHFVPKPSSFRSVKRTSGGSVTEQSSMQHSEHDDGNSPIATARPGFGRDFLSRATSIRNIGQTRGAENSLMGRSEHGSADSALISRDEPIADLVSSHVKMISKW